MTQTSDEAELLARLDARPFLPRTLGYLRLIGPGYMQSAMTLGGGTAFASIFARIACARSFHRRTLSPLPSRSATLASRSQAAQHMTAE